MPKVAAARAGFGGLYIFREERPGCTPSWTVGIVVLSSGRTRCLLFPREAGCAAATAYQEAATVRGLHSINPRAQSSASSARAQRSSTTMCSPSAPPAISLRAAGRDCGATHPRSRRHSPSVEALPPLHKCGCTACVVNRIAASAVAGAGRGTSWHRWAQRGSRLRLGALLTPSSFRPPRALLSTLQRSHRHHLQASLHAAPSD